MSRRRSIVSYFVMIDLLRAIHFGQALTLASNEVLLPTSSQSLSSSVLPNQRSLSSVQSADPLTTLLSTFADAYTAITVFGSLGQHNHSQEPRHLGLPDYHSYLLMTPEVELKELIDRLSKRLRLWGKQYIDVIPKDSLLLYYFCQLYLTFPCIPSLMLLSGYGSQVRRGNSAMAEEDKVKANVEEYKDALPIAWRLLELSKNIDDNYLPVWAPLAVFSAGLVVWAESTFRIELGKGGGHVRLLDLFHQELTRMNMPCAQEMAKTVARMKQMAIGKRQELLQV